MILKTQIQPSESQDCEPGKSHIISHNQTNMAGDSQKEVTAIIFWLIRFKKEKGLGAT